MLRVILKMEMCVSLYLLWECGANLMCACDCFPFLMALQVDTTPPMEFSPFSLHVVVCASYEILSFECECARRFSRIHNYHTRCVLWCSLLWSFFRIVWIRKILANWSLCGGVGCKRSIHGLTLRRRHEHHGAHHCFLMKRAHSCQMLVCIVCVCVCVVCVCAVCMRPYLHEETGKIQSIFSRFFSTLARQTLLLLASSVSSWMNGWLI